MTLADKSILIAEDSPVSAMILEDMLSSLGCQVIPAADGAEALERLEQGTVDLVLMDCRMPNLDGYQATERIRANPRFAELPIIAVTAEQGEDLQRCLDVGMNQVLTKPVELESLRRTLESWLGRPDAATPSLRNSLSNDPDVAANNDKRPVLAEESGTFCL